MTWHTHGASMALPIWKYFLYVRLETFFSHVAPPWHGARVVPHVEEFPYRWKWNQISPMALFHDMALPWRSTMVPFIWNFYSTLDWIQFPPWLSYTAWREYGASVALAWRPHGALQGISVALRYAICIFTWCTVLFICVSWRPPPGI